MPDEKPVEAGESFLELRQAAGRLLELDNTLPGRLFVRHPTGPDRDKTQAPPGGVIEDPAMA